MKMKKTVLILVAISLAILSLLRLPSVQAGASEVYWYAPLDDLSETSYGGEVSNSTIHKQGYGSLKMMDTNASGDTYITVANYSVSIPFQSPLPPPNQMVNLTTFGIYAFFNSSSACPTQFINWLNASGGGVVGFRPHLEGSVMTMDTFLTDPTYRYYDTGISVESLVGAWHWYEISVWECTPIPQFLYYIDGGLVNGFDFMPSGWTWTIAESFVGATYLETFSGYCLYDYLRWNKGEEYPPYLAGAGIFQLDVSSTPINATFVYTDGNQYDFPQSFLVSSGSVQTLTAVSSVRDNATHVHVFDYWDVEYVGLVYSQTVSVEILGDTDLIAHYRDANIPHVEEGWIRIGIGLIGLILMFMSWFIGYWIHKAGDTAKGGLVWFVMFIVGYGLFTVLLGG